MDNPLRAAGGNRRRLRGTRVVIVCAALTTALAIAWATRGAPPRRVPPAAVGVAPPQQAWKAPAGHAPTADEEGERTVLRQQTGSVRDRIEPPQRHPQPGAATARPHHLAEPALSARHRPARPLGPVRQPDRTQQADRSGRTGGESQDPAPSSAPQRTDPAAQRADSTPQRTDETPPSQGQAPTSRVPLPGAAGGGATSNGGLGSGGSGGAGDGARSGSSPAPASGGDDGAAGAAAAAPVQLLPPRVITFAGTDYPGEAFRVTVERGDLGPSLVFQGSEGKVRVRALVRADGSLGAVEVAASSGSFILDRAATQAVRRWVFAPATRNGVPLDAYVTLTIRYVVR